jgi:hypothetical protein
VEFEIVISILAFLIILGMARLGMYFGAFYEVTSTVFLFFAMMFALRYWYLITRLLSPWFSGQNGYAAFGAFWIAFLVGSIPLIILMARVGWESSPRYPRVVDAALGLLFGAVSSAILVCTVMSSLSVIVPKVWSGYNPDKLILPMDKVPIEMYQAVEQRWLGVGPKDPGHTRFPTFEKNDADDLYKYWR